MTTLVTRLHTWLHGQYVGEDFLGNKYYQQRGNTSKKRRWVIYAEEDEASRVPALYHSWLHGRSDSFPDGTENAYAWEQPHEPNRTGTAQAWTPPGHIFSCGKRAAATGDYEAWRPN